MKSQGQDQQSKQEPGAMLAQVEEGILIRGGKDVIVGNGEQLRAEYKKGMAVLPPRIVMLGEYGPDKLVPTAVILDKLAREGSLKLFLKAFFEWPSEDGLGNAHQVAEALMIDLMMAGQADGWAWVTGDLLVGQPPKCTKYSWLEHDGWVVEAACGIVKIYPRQWFRAVFQPRNLVVKDTRQVREMWKRHGGADLVKAIDSQVPSKTAKVYDLETKAIIEIPVSELAPGMVLMQVEGVEGDVWVDATTMRLSDTYFHPPFPPETRQAIARIAGILHEVDPRPISKWEDGFRKELTANRQIFIHACVAEAYQRVTEQANLSAPQKKEIYRAIVQASFSTRDAFLATTNVTTISKTEAIHAGDLFWRIFHEKDGVRKCEEWEVEAETRFNEIRKNRPNEAA